MLDPLTAPAASPPPFGARIRLLIVLSTAGIALLVTLLVTVGPASHGELLLDAGAGVAFFIALVAGTLGLDRGVRVPARDASQRRLESVQLVAFLTGVALVLWLGLATGLTALDPASQDETDTTEQYKTS